MSRSVITIALASFSLLAGGDFQPTDLTPSRVERHSYSSSAMGETQIYNVYLPPGYNPRRADRYPVFYLLHGSDGDASSWIAKGDAIATMDDLIRQRAAVPMVLVMPTGRALTGGRSSTEGFPETLISEILPQVESAYHVSTNRDGRAIAGLSMGAGQAVAIAFDHLDRFAWVGGFSGQYGIVEQHTGRPLESSFDRVDPAAASLRLLYLTCGSDDGLLEWTTRLNRVLTSRGVHTTYREWPQIGHVWLLWRQNLSDMARLVFR